MTHLLSTRLLTEQQRSRLTRLGIEVQHYNALFFEHILREEDLQEDCLYVVTSQEAVKAIRKIRPLIKARAYCVGSNTSAELETIGFQVLGRANNAKELARLICSKPPLAPLTYLCGNQRRDELPMGLRECGIPMKEVIAYHTQIHPKRFPQNFDALLFYSPSGIRSFTAQNPIGESEVFCLGPTTAGEAEQFTKRIHIAPEPRVDALIGLAIEVLSKNN